MKTNSKQVRNEVRNYIKECMNFEGYDEPQNGAGILEIFKAEKGYKIKQVGEQAAFIDWLQGLPSVLPVEMRYEEVRNILINRFKTNTPAKRDDIKSFNFFLYLIYAEVKRWADEPRKESEKLIKRLEKGLNTQ